MVSEIFLKKKKNLFCSVPEEGCRQELKGGGSLVWITMGHRSFRGWERYFSPVVERPAALDSWLSMWRSFPLWSNWQLQVQYGKLSRGLQTYANLVDESQAFCGRLRRGGHPHSLWIQAASFNGMLSAKGDVPFSRKETHLS